jgi:Family of unknown function (DUF6502)
VKRPSRRGPSREPRSPTRPDAHTKEAITRFVRLLARCGNTPEAIAREVTAACRGVPKSWGERVKDTLPYLDYASHILTLWFSDPKFLGADGAPRPLPLQGAKDSIEALTERVDSRLDASNVVRLLVRGKALRRVGNRYVPRERALVLRGGDLVDSFRRLRGLLGMLRGFEHNQRSKHQVPTWFEAFADNPRFPVRAIPAFDRKVRAQANELLVQLDGDMHREERLRDPREPTVRIGVGVYRFEENLEPPANPRKKTMRRPRKLRKRR